MERTYDCLGVFGARGAEAEFAQLRFGFVGEGVEAGFRRLWAIISSDAVSEDALAQQNLPSCCRIGAGMCDKKVGRC